MVTMQQGIRKHVSSAVQRNKIVLQDPEVLWVCKPIGLVWLKSAIYELIQYDNYNLPNYISTLPPFATMLVPCRCTGPPKGWSMQPHAAC